MPTYGGVVPQRTKDSATDRLFGALANPTRRDVLDLLLSGPRTVADIAAHFDMARPSVSEHLKVLKDGGLVAENRRGRFRYYSVEPTPLHELGEWLRPYERFWRERLAAMAELVDQVAAREAAHNEQERP
jgi:DNA-binding transcriptional ArsR family regulator